MVLNGNGTPPTQALLSSLPPSLQSMAQQLSPFIVFVSLGHAFLCFGQCLIFQGAYLSSSSTPTSSWLHFALLLARSQTLRLPSGTELIATEGGLPKKDCRVSLDEAGIPEGPGAWGFWISEILRRQEGAVELGRGSGRREQKKVETKRV